MARSAPALPAGWTSPELRLHRRWHARRALRLRARLALGLLVPLLVAVALGASPLWLAAAGLGLLAPLRASPAATLREIERRYGEAYTTALGAPEDAYGLRERLRGQAATVAARAELPGLPWAELAAGVALVSLLLALPRAAPATTASRPAPLATAPREEASPGPDLAPPVLDAPATGEAPGTESARPGQAASGGSLAEGEVGAVRPGGGAATDDPEAVSREFLEALERGAVRSSGGPRGGGQPGGPRVEDRDAPGVGREGSADGGADPGAGGRSGQGRQGQDGLDPSRPGQRGGGGQGGTNPQQGANPAQGDAGQNPAGSSASGTAGSAQGGQQGNAARRGPDGSPLEPEGQGGEGGEGEGAADADGRGDPGRGGRGTSGAQPQEEAEARGRLEYLPGEAREGSVRSGALQLPGDPSRPLTGTPGTPEYRRAVEGAVLDPRLPPEYQDLLRNYYR